jgi:hypothetical protein
MLSAPFSMTRQVVSENVSSEIDRLGEEKSVRSARAFRINDQDPARAPAVRLSITPQIASAFNVTNPWHALMISMSAPGWRSAAKRPTP